VKKNLTIEVELLEKEIVEAKKTIAQLLVLQKKEETTHLERQQQREEADHATTEATRASVNAQQKLGILLNGIDDAQAELSRIQDVVSTERTTHKTLFEEIALLRVQLSSIKVDIVDSKKQLSIDQATLRKCLDSIDLTTQDLSDLKTYVQLQKSDVVTLLEGKNKILTDIEVAKKTLVDLSNQASLAEEVIKARDADSTARAGRAAELEKHVDEKLVDLQTIEAKYTSEHLARFGYKKTK
jgi:chromosome segregation ATPase